MLGKKKLEEAISRGLVVGMVNPRIQVTAVGVELTVAKIELMTTSGSAAFTPGEESVARLEETEWTGIGGYSRFNNDQAFKVTFSEYVKVPSDTVAIGKPLQTVIDSGATLVMPMLPPSYEGHPTALLIVTNSRGFACKKDARLVVLTFDTLE